jgi:hypothetical protein
MVGMKLTGLRGILIDWEIQKLLEILYSIFLKVYNTSKDQATEKFVFRFKRKAVFIQCVMNEQCTYGI